MDPETAAKWNAWAEAMIARALTAHDELMKEVMGQVIASERRSMRDHVAAELGQQRSEVEILRVVVRGDVTQLKGKTDEA